MNDSIAANPPSDDVEPTPTREPFVGHTLPEDTPLSTLHDPRDLFDDVESFPIPTWIERADMIKQAQQRVSAWGKLQPQIFRRGTTLVRVARDSETGDPVIATYDRGALTAELPNVVEFERQAGKSTLPCDPPTIVINALLGFPDRLDVPVLNQIVTTPVFTRNGELINKQGYSAEAKLWYEPIEGMQLMPPVSENPTQEEIDVARQWIIGEYGMFGEMPWVGPRDRAHAVALTLQPFCRPLIKGPTPLFIPEAPVAGSGKTLIVDCVQTLVFGETPPGGVLPVSDDEVRKRITASLLRGSQFILFDNVTHPVNSPSLAAALIRTKWEDRILGISKNEWLPNQATWALTAKNPSMSKEIARRSIPIALDSGKERPWERVGFHHEDLLGWVHDNRPTLIWAALTIIKAWLVREGPSAGVPLLGSFEAWSKVLGGIVTHVVGIDGFLTGLHDFYDDADEETNATCDFLERWWAQFADRPVRANDLWPLGTALFDSGKSKDVAASMGLVLHGLKNSIHCDFKVTKVAKPRSHWQLHRLGDGTT